MCQNVTDLLENSINHPDSEIAAFLMKGSGGKAFCAGGDVKSIWQSLYTQEGTKTSTDRDFFRTEYKMNYLLHKSLKPQISLWDGVVMGGGVGISVLGEFRICTEKTVFSMPETAIGLFPDVGSSAWLPHIVGKSGKKLVKFKIGGL
jgi:enoyl-CoA hydratase/carnithine racemase